VTPAAAVPKAERTLSHPDRFADRHIGPSEESRQAMLASLGCGSIGAFMDAVIPRSIRSETPLKLESALSEHEALSAIRRLASGNQVRRSYIGTGYYDCVVPAVIQRNILEDPGWYTQYTPYQPEISQGRLEALLNFQTMVIDLTGLPVANSSLLDESTAAAEAMALARAHARGKRKLFLVSQGCHPQTIEVLRTRAWPLGIELRLVDPVDPDLSGEPFGILLQYPTTRGVLHDYAGLAVRAKEAGALVIAAADLLSLTLLKPPGEWGADIAVGSAQRLGTPLAYGGPHAAFLAVRDEFKRLMPGRVVGVSKDSRGKPALRLALQTREQHIRRDRATSNICTAQVLLAILSSMYGVYHGPDGLRAIARRVRRMALLLAAGLKRLGHAVSEEPFFDTLCIPAAKDRRARIIEKAGSAGINLRIDREDCLGVSLDERTSPDELAVLLGVFAESEPDFQPAELLEDIVEDLPEGLARTSAFMTHPVFRSHRSETGMLRYIQRLRSRDLSLTTSMIPLGSCTMKLNAAAELLPISWNEFAGLHPHAPREQAAGYKKLFEDLERDLGEITGFPAVTLQPNAGSQGEFAGLLVIRKYHDSRGDRRRQVCLVPGSAHGTNPASAAMAGMRIVPVACDAGGNIDVVDLQAKLQAHKEELAALMLTYPSTHGVFEGRVREICEAVHAAGGQVYLDGANMNAQVGFCRPAEYGADVCHLNLHKTFAIPHGGGGPGVGPIAVAGHLAPFLPSLAPVEPASKDSVGLIAAAPWGSPSVLPITWMYIKMMGAEGLKAATETAVLNANYLAAKLDPLFPVLYKGENGRVAHECIIDLRPMKAKTGVLVEDAARRLMDHGFHAPTISFPVMGTMMVEPTESESKEELDAFVEAMRAIRAEMDRIAEGRLDKADNPLKNAPHTADQVSADEWTHPYSRTEAAYPSEAARRHKFWPTVSKIDAPYGDRNFICACPVPGGEG